MGASGYSMMRRRGGATWQPSTETGLKLWLRGDLGITLGTGVSTWADQSGNGNNATQATGANQPAQGSGINGQATIVCAASKWLVLPQIAGITGAQTIFIEYKMTSNPGVSVFYTPLAIYTASGTMSSLVYFTNGGGYQPFTYALGYSSGGTGVGTATALDTSKHGLVITYSGSGPFAAANYSSTLDNAAQTVVASSAFGASASTQSAVNADNSSTGTDTMVGEIAEICIWDHVLNGTALGNLNTYKVARYA